MRSAGGRNVRQRPPWRHPQTHHDESDEDTHLDAQLRHHAPPSAAGLDALPSPSSSMAHAVMYADSKRPLRPPPIFHSYTAEDTGVQSTVRRMPYSTYNEGVQSGHSDSNMSATSQRSAYSEDGPHADSQARCRPGREEYLYAAVLPPSSSPASPPDIPVSHWRQRSAPGIHAATSRPADTPSVSPQVRGAANEENAFGGHRVMEGGTSHSAAVVEHYHVLELEEQLQYWRQRALQMEGRSLQRERSIREKYSADFAAAQEALEVVIRQLLDKQRRLQQQLLKARQQRISSRAILAPSCSDPSSISSAASSQEGGHNSIDEDDGDAGLRGLRQQVGELTKGSSAPSAALAVAQQEMKDTTAASAARPLHTKSMKDSLMGATEAACESVARKIIAIVQPRIESVVQALLRCLEHSSELQHCCTALNADGISRPPELSDQTASHGAQEKHHRLITQLMNSLHPLHEVQHSVTASEVESLIGETFARQLEALRNAIEFLEHLLVTCLDDVVIASKPGGNEKLQRPPPKSYDAHESLDPLRQADLQREQKHESELSAGRASAAQQKTRHTASVTEPQAAGHSTRDLLEKQKNYEAALEAHEAELEQVRRELSVELMEAARRVSAAEYECTLHAEREAQWRARVGAVEKARDAYAQECAVLKGRLEVLQLSVRNSDRKNAANGAKNHSTPVEAVSLKMRTEVAAAQRRPWAGRMSGSARCAGTAATDGRPGSSPPLAPEASLQSRSSGSSRQSAIPQHALHHREVDTHSRNFKKSVEAIPGQGTQSIDEDAATPRRSLSYSPPESAGKPESSPVGALHSRTANADVSMVKRREWGGEKSHVTGAAITYPLQTSSSVPASPVCVVQPSLLADCSAHDVDDDAVAVAPGRMRLGNSRTPQYARRSSSSPPARMKAWEEKFKSILMPACGASLRGEE
ncbi:hypothetical protein ABL78_3455 [Leptomonas seymouri]|uniref:Uncharacterized protein n=1 Tax=Leptomonas seymouri TaxID=5684 RepID=A0A0N0P6C2_LEPSE|nr:hypothetical protein ABL78_3455 [Leptomonas seymouri]|eukprot:KPI87466.1 hypothetical protein ABL78_3455 [Leptomonas seymouri]